MKIHLKMRGYMLRKAAWIFSSFLVVLILCFLLRDPLVSIILEKHTARTCGKLLGGECAFGSRQREGNTLHLKDVTIRKAGLGSANAADLAIHWEYDWLPPFVSFDVKVKQLKGDASMLPLYGVWKAVKHASARRGIRLRSWEFEDVSLNTPAGNVQFKRADLAGNEGRVQVQGSCMLPSKGDLDIAGGVDGTWKISMRSASAAELFHLLHCWAGSEIPLLPKNMEGTVTANATINSSGLKGEAIIHSLTYGEPSLVLANISIAIQADPSLKDWKFEGQFGAPPLNFSATISRSPQYAMQGKLWGTKVSLSDVLNILGDTDLTKDITGEVDLEGEFDSQGLFAAFTPRSIKWDIGSLPIILQTDGSSSSPTGKIWVNYSKGIERLWLNLNQSRLRWGSMAEALIDGDVELYKNALRAHNLKTCCGDLVVQASLLGSNIAGEGTLLLAEGEKTNIGSWKIRRFEAKIDPKFHIETIKIEGSADASSVQEDLRKLGIEIKNAPASFPGKVWLIASYTKDNGVSLKGKWKTELLSAEATLKADIESLDQLVVKSLNASVLVPGIGSIANYSLTKEPNISYVDFAKQTINLTGKLNYPGNKGKPSAYKIFKIAGPWNNLAWETYSE